LKPGLATAFVSCAAALLLPFGAAAVELSGQVLGHPDGEPLSGVQVLVVDRLGQAATDYTVEDGSFLVSGIDPGLQRVRAAPPLELNRIGAWYDDRYFFCGADFVDLEEGAALAHLDLRLPAGGAITGVISDQQGVVAGATVVASGLDFFNSSLRRTATTDAQGAFRIVGLDSIVLGDEPFPGNYRLSVQASGRAELYFPAAWDVESAVPVPAFREQDSEASLQFPAPSIVSGRVLDVLGGVVADAQVSLHLSGGAGVRLTSSDALGNFRFESVHAGAVTVSAEAVGLARSWYPTGAVPEDAERLLLSPGEEAGLELVLAPEARLTVSVQSPGETGVRLLVIDQESGSQLRAASLSDQVQQQLELGMLPAREVTVRLEPAAGSFLASTEGPAVELVAGESSQQALSLSLGAGVLASVRRRGGAALRGAELSVVAADGSAELLGWARSDGAGLLELRGLPGGREVRLHLSLQTFCVGDPTSVSRWWPASRTESGGEVLVLEDGEVLDAGEVLLPPDADADQMDDIWELAWGLNPRRPDGSEDPDADGLSNLQEYLGDSDPLTADREPLGCGMVAGRSHRIVPVLGLLLGTICRIRGRRRRKYALT